MINSLDLEEQEQLDQLKFFWKKHGKIISIIVFFALLILIGWNILFFWKENENMKSAQMYEQMQIEIKSGNLEENFIHTFSSMKSRFPDSEYTHQAALVVSKYFFQKKDIERTQEILNWILDQSSDSYLKDIALLRLTNVYLANNSFQKIDQILKKENSKYVSFLLKDNLGDVEILKNNKKSANAIYNNSYMEYGNQSSYGNILKIKIDSTATNK